MGGRHRGRRGSFAPLLPSRVQFSAGHAKRPWLHPATCAALRFHHTAMEAACIGQQEEEVLVAVLRRQLGRRCARRRRRSSQPFLLPADPQPPHRDAGNHHQRDDAPLVLSHCVFGCLARLPCLLQQPWSEPHGAWKDKPTRVLAETSAATSILR